MKIDFESIDRKRFNVSNKTIPELGEFVFVCAKKKMFEWSNDELHLRSLLCRPNGEVVSAGFPKFFNFSENPENDALTVDGFKNGNTLFVEKLDGSLVIRSIIDGKVHFRTRGCETISDLIRSEFEELVLTEHPELLDPTFGRQGSSLLFEFVSQKNQIVVLYDKPMLFVLGWSDFSGTELRFWQYNDEKPLRKPKIFNLSSSINEFREYVYSLKDVEGIVSWTSKIDGSIHLTKFKSKWYLRLHTLRTELNERYLKQYCYFNKIETLDQFKEALSADGHDWETFKHVEPMFKMHRAKIEAAKAWLANIEALVKEKGIDKLSNRKDKAENCKELEALIPGCFFYAIMYVTATEEKLKDIKEAHMLDMSLGQFHQFKINGMQNVSDNLSEVDE